MEPSVFCLRRVFIAYYRVSYLFVRVSPVFVRTQGYVLPPLRGGLLYNFFAFALFFIGVATLFKNRLGLSLPKGLTTRWVYLA